MRNTLRLRFIFTSIALAIIVSGIVAVSFWVKGNLVGTLKETTSIATALKNHLESDMMHDAIRGDVLYALGGAVENNMEDINSAMSDYKEHSETFASNVEANKKIELPEEIKNALNNVLPALNAYTEEAGKIISQTKFGYENAKKMFPAFMEKFSELEESMEEVSDKLEEYSTQNYEESEKTKELITIIMSIASVIAIIAIALMPILVIIWIFRPLNLISNDIQKLASDDTNIDLNRKTVGEINFIYSCLLQLREAVSSNLLMQKMTSDYPVVRCDKDFKITFVNDAAEKELTKLTLRKDGIENKGIEALHANLKANSSLYKDSKNLPKVERLQIKEQWVDATINIIEDENGFDGIYINLLNVTDAVKNEESVKKAQFEIQNLIDGAYNGELNNRIDAGQFEGFYKDLAGSLNGLMDAIVKPIEVSIETLKLLSDGDLTTSMEGSFSGSFGEIQKALNNTIGNLKGMVSQIINTADAVASASSEISAASTDLSHRTEEQASNLEETSASMEQMTSSVQENSEHSKEANSLANETSSIAQTGGDAVRKTVTSMNSISEASQKIVDIISVIDEIAFQTNLLALNAAVEAARAGDAGKGFAVVADEVRALAGRSASSSKEIKELITNSVQRVKEGVTNAEESGKTIESILEAVKKLTEIVSGISNSSNEQRTGIEQVNAAISQLDSMTQQNASMVEENTAAAESLKSQAADLQKLMRFFKLDSSSNVKQLENRVKLIKNNTSHDKISSKEHQRSSSKASKNEQTTEINGDWEEF